MAERLTYLRAHLHHGFHIFVMSLGGIAHLQVQRTVTAVDGAGTVDVGSFVEGQRQDPTSHGTPTA